jgi:hypothetical protein
MAQPQDTPEPSPTEEEALTVLFCLIDDAYYQLNPNGRRYDALKRLSDSEVLTLALFQQSFGASSLAALSCATSEGPSPACSRAWSVFGPPRCTAGC